MLYSTLKLNQGNFVFVTENNCLLFFEEENKKSALSEHNKLLWINYEKKLSAFALVCGVLTSKCVVFCGLEKKCCYVSGKKQLFHFSLISKKIRHVFT